MRYRLSPMIWIPAFAGYKKVSAYADVFWKATLQELCCVLCISVLQCWKNSEKGGFSLEKKAGKFLQSETPEYKTSESREYLVVKHNAIIQKNKYQVAKNAGNSLSLLEQ